MKYMHNIPESYKEIILLAIISHLTESLKAHSTIHQAQTYPSEYVCIASLKERAKRSPGSSQEHSTLPHSPHGHTGACRPFCSKTSQAKLLPSKTATWATWSAELPTASTAPRWQSPDTASGWTPKPCCLERQQVLHWEFTHPNVHPALSGKPGQSNI